ncbi:hypothetical protein Ahos_1435 [Acidianus hospitalis W1]|uniref:Uncharacterized protein n=1 Tax=Acidianus hospitalis (strain W1) TaxID=933801 RepID=F4B516_ACIHW|nr:hypothetical protein Ahos_1435 [Acidianus hospitalis W1]
MSPFILVKMQVTASLIMSIDVFTLSIFKSFSLIGNFSMISNYADCHLNLDYMIYLIKGENGNFLRGWISNKISLIARSAMREIIMRRDSHLSFSRSRIKYQSKSL